MNDKELVKAALKARENSYSPYSTFRVGAALLDVDGRLYTGCNVENASFGATNCAERTAIFKAVSEGSQKIAVLAIASDSEDFIYPCGICRQVMAEFNIHRIIVSKSNGEYLTYGVNDLLPYAFTEWVSADGDDA